jgi:uridine phosphorylase
MTRSISTDDADRPAPEQQAAPGQRPAPGPQAAPGQRPAPEQRPAPQRPAPQQPAPQQGPREQEARIRRAVWDANPYRDRLPERGLIVDGRPALTGIDPDGVGRYVVLSVRDPLAAGGVGHAQRLASLFGPAVEVGSTGLFQAWTAPLGDDRVTVVATGSGSPELELALVELMEHTAAEVFCYFGVAAGIHPRVAPGDVVVPTGIVRDEGMTKAYVEAGFPAAASYDLVAEFVAAAAEHGVRAVTGVTRSVDSDLLGNGRPSVGGYQQPEHARILDYWIRAGVLCNDRESAAVVTLATLFGRRGASVLAVTDNFPMGATLDVGAGVAAAETTLVEGLRRLERRDAAALGV